MTSASKRSEVSGAPNPHLSGYLHRENQKRRGNCYVTCEALYHLLGGKAAHYTPRVMSSKHHTSRGTTLATS